LLRVTALTTARERGSDIIDLQDFAGHADPRTTLTYIRSRDRLRKSPAYVLKVLGEIAMPSRQHEKPTTPFGFVAFSKDGTVDISLSTLPKVKDDQEAEVIRRFAHDLTCHYGLSVSDIMMLPERDHDASMTINGQHVVLQITEIWQRGFELPPGSPDPGNPNAIGYLSAINHLPAVNDHSTIINVAIQLDSSKMNDAIRRAIEKKLDKHYAPDGDTTWLLVFTTSPHLLTETFRDGEHVIEEPLRRAREFMAGRSPDPFSQIWFTNLITRPVRIWPPFPS
jgi:hypothetical protein